MMFRISLLQMCDFLSLTCSYLLASHGQIFSNEFMARQSTSLMDTFENDNEAF